MDKKTIIDVIPLTRLPLNRQPHFSYLSDKKIPVGSLVSVPLFFRNISGIVINNRQDFARFGNIRLKNINKIIAEDALTEKQMELARFISEYYFCPLGVVLKFFVPKIAKSHNIEHGTWNKRFKINLSQEHKSIVDQIINSRDSKFLFHNSPGLNKAVFYTELAKNITSRNKQFLLLLPELNLAVQASESFENYFGTEKVALLHSKLAKGQFFSNWQKIKSGQAKIVIGTRMAVFAPFVNLGLITIEDEQDNSFKQWDMNPRYDARTVADKLAELYGAKFILASIAPRIEEFYKSLNDKYKLITISNFKFQISNSIIVDMRKEYRNNRISPRKKIILSKPLTNAISETLNNKGRVLLYVNRRGMSQFSVCSQCKTVLKCPRCERALIYDVSGIYKCLHCNYKTDIFVQCSRCRGNIFTNIGIGTQLVEKEILNIFPNASVKRIDLETAKKLKELENIWTDRANKKIDIVIGTQMASKSWKLQNFDLIGIVDADSLFGLPDPWVDENAFQIITQLISRTYGDDTTGRLFIQTYQPENNVIRWATQMNFRVFYNAEISERVLFHLPPFGKIIRLIYQDDNRIRVEKETNKVYDVIRKAKKNDRKLYLTEPADPLAQKIRGRFRKQIVIKLIGKNSTIPDYLNRLLRNLGNRWIIDVDPINLS